MKKLRFTAPLQISVLMLSGIVFNLYYLLLYSAFPTFSTPGMDAAWFLKAASELYDNGFIPGSLQRPVGYPIILAILKFFDPAIFRAAYILNFAAVLGQGILIYKIFQQIFNKDSWYPFAGSLLFLVLPETAFFSGQILDTTVFSLFSVIMVYFLMLAFSNNKLSFFMISAAAYCAAFWIRPAIILFIPFLLLVVVIDKNLKFNKIKLFVLISFFGLLPAILQITHNYQHSGHFPVLAYNSGTNFYIGNNAEADGFSAKFPDMPQDWTENDVRKAAYKASGYYLNDLQVSRYWQNKGWDFIKNNPVLAGKLWLKKIWLFCSGERISNNLSISATFNNLKFFSVWQHLVSVRWLMPAGLTGLLIMCFFVKKFSFNRSILISWILAVLIVNVVFFANARFRFPAVFVVIAGIFYLFDFLQKSNSFRRFCALFILIFTGIILNLQLIKNPDDTFQFAFAQATALDKQGKIKDAEQYYQMLMFGNHENVSLLLNLSRNAFMQAKYGDARKHLLLAASVDSSDSRIWNNLGMVERKLRHDSLSIYYLRKALQLDPLYEEPAFNLADYYFKKGYDLGVRKYYRPALLHFFESARFNPGRPETFYYIGLTYRDLNVSDSAYIYLVKSLNIDPGYKPALKLLQQEGY